MFVLWRIKHKPSVIIARPNKTPDILLAVMSKMLDSVSPSVLLSTIDPVPDDFAVVLNISCCVVKIDSSVVVKISFDAATTLADVVTNSDVIVVGLYVETVSVVAVSDITVFVVNIDVCCDILCSVTDTVGVVDASVILSSVVLVCNFDKSIFVCCEVFDSIVDDAFPVVDSVIMSVVKDSDVVGVDSSDVVCSSDEGFVVTTSIVVTCEDDGTIVVCCEVVVSSHAASHGKQRNGVEGNVSLVPNFLSSRKSLSGIVWVN